MTDVLHVVAHQGASVLEVERADIVRDVRHHGVPVRLALRLRLQGRTA